MEFIRLRGVGVSPGIALGEIVLTERVVFTSRKEDIASSLVGEEIERLKRAVERAKADLLRVKEKTQEKIGEEHAFIFDAHLLILEDKSLAASLEKIIREEKAKAEWALSQVNRKYRQIFDSLNDEYFRQRQDDLADVLAKVYLNLDFKKRVRGDEAERREIILIAHDLLPSEAALKLSRGNVVGVAMDMGGQTSHTAILARSLNIPTVVGLHNVTQQVGGGDYVIVDGTDGEVLINPPSALRKEFQSKKEKYDSYRRELKKTAKLKSVTLDDVKFFPLANIELLDDVPSAFSLGAEGIGLFRSEFIYLQSDSLPSEEDHFSIYAQIAKAAHPRPVYIRTMDIGGEKAIPQLSVEKEPNPALGLRAIRLSLKNRDLFKIQLKAILRAGALGNVRILFPMITEVEEIGEVKLLLSELCDELESKRVKFNRHIPLGVMIEVPAAAAIADILVREVDYISIGTNDLIQYCLAVDRSNEFVSYLYKPLHPSVLKLIKSVIEAAVGAGKDVTVCGEMAADPLSALILLGFGVQKFSMNPIFIPRIKKTLRAVEFRVVKDIVERALNLKTAQEVEECVIEGILAKYPKAFLIAGSGDKL